MEQEYTISTGMKIFYGLIGLGMFIFAFFVFNIHKNPNVSDAVYLIPVIMAACGGLILASIFRRKVTIYNDRIVCTSMFTTREMAIADIKGYRLAQNKNNNIISLESNSPDGTRMRIGSYTDFANSKDLANWAKAFTDLDALDIKNEQNAILNDSTIGFTPEDRGRQLQQAKTVAKIYNIGGVVISFAMIFFYSKLCAVVLMIIPLIGVFVLLTSKRLIKFFSNPKRSIYPSIVGGFIVPCFILLFKSIAAFDIFSTDNVWLPGLTITAIMFVILLLIGLNKTTMTIVGQIFLMVLVSTTYGFGTVLQVNCVFDESVPKVYKAAVLDHRISHGKSTSYYLSLSEWGPRNKVKEVNVGRRLYDTAPIGDTVSVYFKNGKLNIPWFTVYK